MCCQLKHFKSTMAAMMVIDKHAPIGEVICKIVDQYSFASH
jgi:hypothetical protein